MEDGAEENRYSYLLDSQQSPQNVINIHQKYSFWCAFFKKVPFLANIQRCPKFLQYALPIVYVVCRLRLLSLIKNIDRTTFVVQQFLTSLLLLISSNVKSLHPFNVTSIIMYPLKRWENLRFSVVFGIYKKDLWHELD